jgi:hypothetical protein
MYNSYSMYLISKSIQEDRLKEGERQRLIYRAKAQQSEERGGDRSLVLSLVARSAIVIALAIVLNIAA